MDTTTNPLVAIVAGLPELATPAQLAPVLGLTEAGLARRRVRGTGPAYLKFGTASVRYARADVLAWLESARRES